MNKMVRLFGVSAAILASVAIGASGSRAATIDLGFALDGSGSINAVAFALERQGLADALAANIPYAGGIGAHADNGNLYRISVVEFGTTAGVQFTATITNAAALATLVGQVNGLVQSQGNTCISCATTALNTAFAGLPGGAAATSLYNISTDGVANTGTTNGATLRAALIAAGVDGVSAEAIGDQAGVAFLTALAYPTPVTITGNTNNLPDPFTNGFVLLVDNFLDFGNAIDAKIANIVNSPVPGPIVGAGLPGLLAACGFLLAFARRRRQLIA